MKFTLGKIEFSTADSVTRWEDRPIYTAARERHTNAVDTVQAAKRRVEQAEQLVSALPARVAAGQASEAALIEASRERDIARALLPQHEQRLREREQERDAAANEAKAQTIAAAGKVRDELQRAAEQVAPFLEALRTVEGNLDQLVRDAGGHAVEALRWPPTLEQECGGMFAHVAALVDASARTAQATVQ